MQKFIVSALAVAVLLTGTVASAQVYYPGYPGASCGTSGLTSTLSYGSRGDQVSALQRFLVAQNYPGGGSWMVTGYFGSATVAALRIYQGQHGLSQTGSLDSSTLASINNCGGYNNYIPPFTPTYQTYPSYPVTPVYNNCTNYYGYSYGYNPCSSTPNGNVTITSMSQNTGVPGNSVTLYGAGFDLSGNIVYFGSQAVSALSSNGSAITFVVPSYYTYAQNQQVQIYVVSSRGTSNSVSFTLNPNSGYGYGYGCGYPYTYGYNSNCYQPPVNNITNPIVTYIDPSTGSIGTNVTVVGSGFSTTGNSVHFGQGIIANLNSPDGRSVSFAVPATLTGYGSQPIALGTYNVSVTNAAGYTSNSMPFTITSLGNVGQPTITNVQSPSNLAVGQVGTWTITINNPGSSYATVSVNWGDTGYGYVNQAAPQTVYSGSQTLTFTHTYFTSNIYTVTFTVTNSAGQSNTTTATVSVGGTTSGSIVLNSISPQSGHVGTQVVLTGSGFTADNTVHFGQGGTMHVYSQNGTTIYYTIPSYISPCDVNQYFTVCAQYAQQVMPGQYPIYVTNQNGTSQTVNFWVN